MTADAESQRVANVEGTRQAVKLAKELDAKRFHMVSSIAAAGLYKGTFTEDMFDEAEKVENHPYFQTKHESEAVVREESEVPWRVYRPGIVVGHSETGEIDKIDGPYYFFKLLQRARNAVPQWFPGVGVEGGKINIVPVDFVAKAMDHIAHIDGFDGQAFHLTDPNPLSAGQVINVFAKAAHAPEAVMRIDSRMFDFIPKPVRSGLTMLPRRSGSPTWSWPSSASRERCSSTSTTRPTSTRPRRRRRSRGPASRCRRSRATPRRSGSTGSATSARTAARTARSHARSRARP